MGKYKQIEKIGPPKDTRVSISQKGIEIRHEGKPVSGGPLTGYVYLLVDCSASMEGDKLKQAKKGALNFAKDALSKGYFTGLIRFDSSPRLICEPFKDVSNLEKRLVGLEIGDTTHMGKAINLAHELLKEMQGIRVMVVVTDGMPNGPGDPIASLNAGQNAKKYGIEIIVIGMPNGPGDPIASLNAGQNAKKYGIEIIVIGTDDADQEFLKRLASRAELGIKVPSKQLEKTITGSAKMLPPGEKGIVRK